METSELAEIEARCTAVVDAVGAEIEACRRCRDGDGSARDVDPALLFEVAGAARQARLRANDELAELLFEATGRGPLPEDPDGPVWAPFGIQTRRHVVWVRPHCLGVDVDPSDARVTVIPRADLITLGRSAPGPPHD